MKKIRVVAAVFLTTFYSFATEYQIMMPQSGEGTQAEAVQELVHHAKKAILTAALAKHRPDHGQLKVK